MSEPFPSWPKIEQDACLIQEELCRVIASAKRFQTCEEAWRALLTVRRISEGLIREARTYHGQSEDSGATPLVGEE